ncbi:unnamed protein product [Vitrella brassicaformis CCMP3155]|uniref:Uncharacterized protein n=1 Tax=Vitrella brassicaformis (strain CCMP3155) TaxID=1169540 RepID=A0A0G4F1V6_VITBC|nr:unnamed protein product [Vitrella brassicaformis CCMP3155]|eukprot:CEM05513.1 unnamed protein product [Vitrella brassicaformis CCMP3155]
MYQAHSAIPTASPATGGVHPPPCPPQLFQRYVPLQPPPTVPQRGLPLFSANTGGLHRVPPLQPSQQPVAPQPTAGGQRPQKHLAPPLKVVPGDPSCEEGEVRIELNSFVEHINYLWEKDDRLLFGTIVLGSTIQGEHIGCYFANMDKGGEFFSSTRPDGYQEKLESEKTEVPLGGLPPLEEHKFFQRLCPRGAAGRLKDALLAHIDIKFHMFHDNCGHFERDLRAAVMRLPAREVSPFDIPRTWYGDMCRRLFPCCGGGGYIDGS